MKKSNLLAAFALLLVASGISSCTVVTGIFKAGMGFGIFMVVLVIAVIIFIAMKATKK